MRINLQPHECKLARDAFSYLIDLLAEDIQSHGVLTKWARAHTREELIALRDKFPEVAK
jgi:hypothetical protein